MPEYADLLDILAVRRGLICAVGAGGKKTTLYRIAGAHPGRVGITTSVFLAPFPDTLPAERVIAPPGILIPEVLEAARRSRIVAFAHQSEKPGRHGGLSLEELSEVSRQAVFDVLLVKADGARMRLIKGPAEDEPLLPEHVDTVLYLVSARAIGAILDEDVAHRIERIEAITGAVRGQPIEPEHVARLLASPQGALKGIGDARIVPIINAADDDEQLRLARETARIALGQTGRYSRIVIARMNREDPILDVIEARP